MATTYIRYIKQRKYVNGVATDEYRKGGVIDTTEWASQEACESGTVITPIYQWITAEGEYECVGYDKYSKEKRQVSNDNGSTWSDTGEVRTGSLIESNSEDCGYSPEPADGEWVLTSDFETLYEDGNITSNDVGFVLSQGSASNYMTISGQGTEIRFRDSIVSGGYIDSSNMTSMRKMFEFCNNLESLDASQWDTSNVQNMEYMFNYCRNLTSLDVSGFDTSKVDFFGRMFRGCEALTSLDVSSFDTSDASDMDSMFSDCYALTSLDLSNFNTSNVTDMGSMFSGCKNLTSIDISSFDTSKLTDMSYMFYGCINLEIVHLPDFGSSVNISHLFGANDASIDDADCKKLREIHCTRRVRDKILYDRRYTTFIYLPVEFLDPDYEGWVIKDYRWVADGYICVDNDKYEQEKEQNSTDNGVTWTDTGETRVGSLVEENSEDCGYVADVEWVLTSDFSKISGSILKSNNTGLMPDFTVSQGSESNTCVINGNGTWISFYNKIVHARYLDSSNITTLEKLFNGKNYLISADLRGWDTSNVTSMNMMFYGCNSLTTLDLSSFNTSNVTDMKYMFYNCSNLTTLDLSSFNTSNVTDMYGMFDGCQVLTSLDLSSFNTSKVTNMYRMFAYCYALTSLDLSNFDTSNVTDMTRMFAYCYALTSLDLSSFNTSKVTNMDMMFYGCNSLTTITTNSTFRDWCIANATKIYLPSKFKNSSYSGWVIV